MIEDFTRKWLVKLIEEALRDIKSGNCNLPEEEVEVLFDALGNKRMNKVEASQYVHLSESQFDNEVRVGRIPRGQKLIKGDSKIYWTKRDLIIYIKRWRNK